MPIKPEEISAENLPQGVRGYQREATENLLKLVAWDYRRVMREHTVDAEELQRVRAHNDQLETELQALRSLLDSQPTELQSQLQSHVNERTAELEADVARLQAQLEAQSHKAELSETLLASALRSARELREQTRADCEDLLKAARRRAQEIESEAVRSVKHATGELERLRQMERDLRDQLRRILESVIDRDAPPAKPRLPAPLPPEDTLTLPPAWTTGD